jgi:uncharacterized protein (TIGR02001 family)
MGTISKLCLFGAIAILALPNPAFADPNVDQVVGTASLTTDYRYRGISENRRHATPQGSLTWSSQGGFYASAWLSEVNWTGNGHAFLEADLYAGKHFDIGGNDLDAEAYYYSYPGHGGFAANYFEGIFHLTHNFGPVAATVTGAASPSWSNNTGPGFYVAGAGAYPIADWLTISATLGHQWVGQAPRGYTHYDFGVTATKKSISLDLRYVGNDIRAQDALFWVGATPQQARMWTRGAVILTASYAFSLL